VKVICDSFHIFFLFGFWLCEKLGTFIVREHCEISDQMGNDPEWLLRTTAEMYVAL